MLKSILNLPTGSFCDSLVVELPIVRIFDSWIFWTFVDLLPDERPKGGLDTEVVLAVNRFNHLGMTASQNCKAKKNEYFSCIDTHRYKSSGLSKNVKFVWSRLVPILYQKLGFWHENSNI